MARWLRFERNGRRDIGTLDGETITIFEGDMFAEAAPTGETAALGDVRTLTPCDPGKMICLWNNFHALAEKADIPVPPEPLYLLKAPNAFLGPGETIRRPSSYDGKVVYEGEIGIVIGRTCSAVSETDAPAHIFGYTCINDVTAIEIIARDPTFAQWARSKSFDTFGVFGPVIATDVNPMDLHIKTVLNGAERQNYPVSDMIFPPLRLVSLLSHDMTLEPGDVIACGTSVGVGSMKEPSNNVMVTIDGIGALENRFIQ